MSKRTSEIVNSGSSSMKIQRVLSEYKEFKQQILPDEMITMIISHLNEIKDLKNCLLSSKYIQDLMLKAPEIMRKIKFSFKADIKIGEIAKFLSEKGKYIRKIGIDSNDGICHTETKNPLLIPYIAYLTPNLEYFSCEGFPPCICFNIQFSNYSINYNPFCMHRLKHLSLCDQMLNFITNAQNIVNLETLNLGYDTGYVEVIEFLCQQQNLKELTLHNDSTLFQYQDISNKVKFNLKKFEYLSHFYKKSQNFNNFIKMQAGSLEELSISGPLNLELHEIILTKCKNLKKFNSFSFFKSSGFENVSSDWTLSNLRYFDGGALKLNFVYAVFPNLVSLKCEGLENAEGTFDKLESLDVEILNCCRIQNCIFPNLKNISVCSITEEHYWEQYTRNVPKLENFKIRKASTFPQIVDILKGLKFLKNIKIFDVLDPFIEYKVSINTNSKVVEISEKLFKIRQHILNILGENFKNFSFKQVLS